MIFRASQAPLKIGKSSPVPPDLPLDSRHKAEVKSHVEEPLSISSLNESPARQPLTFQGSLNHAPVNILIDSGAMGNFVSQQAADRFSFALSHVSNIPVVFANGATGACNKAALAAYLRFEDHEERVDLRVVSLPHHDVILGQPWLQKWNPSINWRSQQIHFDSSLTPTPSIAYVSATQLEQTLTDEDEVFLCQVSPEGLVKTNETDP